MRDDEFYRAVGARLRRRRRLLDLTQREVAASCGLTFQQIQKYEAGLVAIPIGRMVALARALHAPVGDLVDGVADTEAEPYSLPAPARRSVAA